VCAEEKVYVNEHVCEVYAYARLHNTAHTHTLPIPEAPELGWNDMPAKPVIEESSSPEGVVCEGEKRDAHTYKYDTSHFQITHCTSHRSNQGF
jgi:hypothetical protein